VARRVVARSAVGAAPPEVPRAPVAEQREARGDWQPVEPRARRPVAQQEVRPVERPAVQPGDSGASRWAAPVGLPRVV
jgi:hypothetical protein